MNSKRLVAADLAECALFIALMVAAAYIQIPFPLVPLTFQTAVAVLCGLLLGAKKGVAAMTAYAVMGLLGLPVFSAGGGVYYFLKPSFGYILGFIASAFAGGFLVSHVKRNPTFKYVIAALAAFSVDYLIGIPYCLVAAHLLKLGDLVSLLIYGNLIYMPKDLALSLLAAILATRLSPVLSKLQKRSR